MTSIQFHNSSKKFLFVLGLFLLSLSIQAQNKNYAYYDAASYAQYSAGAWDEVIVLCNEAIDQGFSSYFIQIRMAYAYFYLGNYRKAGKHFKESLLFSPKDNIAKQMYFLSLKYSGQKERAAFYARKHDLEGVSFVLDANAAFSSTAFSYPGNDPSINSDNVYVQYAQESSSSVYEANFTMVPSNFLSLTFSAKTLTIQKNEHIKFYDQNDPEISQVDYSWGFVRSVDLSAKPSETLITGKVNQSEYYLKAGLQLSEKWMLHATVNFIQVKIPNISSEITFESHYDTALYIATTDSVLPMEYETYQYTNKQYGRISINEHIVYLGFTGDFGKSNIRLFGTYSNFMERNQYEAGLYYTFYPQGNLNFYLQAGGIYLNDDGNGSIIADGLLGFSLSKSLWFNTWLQVGRIKQANFMEGSLVFNQPEKVNLRTGAGFIYLISEHLQFSLNYVFQQKNQEYISVSSQKEITFVQQEYYSHTINGGIKWTF